MAITVTPNLTDISLCEATTGWSSGALNSLAGDQLQGTYCMALQVKATTSAIIKYDMTSANFTGKHLYGWLKVNGTVDTKANGGFRLYVEDTSGNYGVWYVGGKDTGTVSGGWQCYVIDPASTPTTGSGTVNVSLVRYVGCQFKTLTSVVSTTQNCFWDAFRYGTGLTINSLSSDTITFENIFTQDDSTTYKWGVVTKVVGCYVIQGKLTFGDTGTGSISFVDTNQIVLFPDNAFVSTTCYGIEVLANSTGTINFTLGSKSGSSGVQGCVLKAVGTRTFTFTASNTNIDILKLYGTTFIKAGTITLLPNVTGREVLNCNFNTCGEVTADTCVITSCNFISSTGNALLLTSSHNVTYCSFISCVNATHLNTAGPYTYSYLTFSGNTYDVNNTYGSSITVNLSNSNATTYTGSAVVFVADPVTISVTALDAVTLTEIENAIVLILASDATGPFPYRETVTIVNSGTTATVTHTGHGMATDDKVQIEGASLAANNGVFTITKTGTDTYTYTMASSPGSSPTGTILSTFVAVFGLTNSVGYASASRVYSSDQPITGRVRKSSASPYYKTGVISGIIDTVSGFAVTVMLISDE